MTLTELPKLVAFTNRIGMVEHGILGGKRMGRLGEEFRVYSLGGGMIVVQPHRLRVVRQATDTEMAQAVSSAVWAYGTQLDLS